MSYRFKIVAHSTRPGEELVEVYDGEDFVGALYPGMRRVRFISKYIAAAVLDQRHPATVEIILVPASAPPREQ
jgi:hypothetical protein